VRRFRWIAVAVSLLAVDTGRARAGVTIETRIDVTMLGGTGQGTGTVEVQGTMRREVRTLDLDAPGASELGAAQKSDAITRLDKGVQWQLDADDSSYRAVPLSHLGDMASAGNVALPGLTPEAASTLTWKVVVTPTQESAVVAGYAAHRTDITLTGTSHAEDAGPLRTIRLVTQWWMATAAPGAAELRAFDRGFARATGGLGADVPGLLAGLPGAADAIARLERARSALPGVPLRTILQVEAPGVASLLGSMGGGDKAGGEDDVQAMPLVTSTIEVTSIRAGKVPAARFAVPAGFHAQTADAAPPTEVHE